MLVNISIFMMIVNFVCFNVSHKLFLDKESPIPDDIKKLLSMKYVMGSKVQDEIGLPTMNLWQLLTLVPAFFLLLTVVGVFLFALTIFIYG